MDNEKTIDMHLLMLGLGIEAGDIVKVQSKVLICADNYDLINFCDSRYSAEIPNHILGMVSGKYPYVVYKVKNVEKYDKAS